MLQLKNIGILSTYNSKTDSFDYLKNCNIDIENGIIIGLGESKHNGDQVIDCNHKLVTPGFVDAHTHPVFVNGREKEFIERKEDSTLHGTSLYIMFIIVKILTLFI